MDTIYTIGELLSAVQTSIGKFGRTWWRGQPTNKPLAPRVYRDGATHRMEWLRGTQFKQKAAPRYGAVPLEEDSAGWLFLMQHYGLPTRLLDWTESPLIATYFAVRDNDEHDACLWALGAEGLNADQYGQPELIHPTKIKTWFDAAFLQAESTSPGLKRVLSVLTTETNVRMLQQQSAFTIHGTATPIEKLDNSSQYLACFHIPAAAKRELWKALVNLGIRDSTLFPDLDHLAVDLCETIGRVS